MVKLKLASGVHRLHIEMEREAKERAVGYRKQGKRSAEAECSPTVASLIMEWWGA